MSAAMQPPAVSCFAARASADSLAATVRWAIAPQQICNVIGW